MNTPFETFDFELGYREIDIPDGFEATIKDNKIILKKKESEDEKIKKDLIKWIEDFPDTIWRGHYKKDIIAWLEKQVSWEKALVDAKKYEAVSITHFIDRKQIGFLTNTECKDLYNAVINDDWKKVYDYMKKKFEKQDEPSDTLGEALQSIIDGFN